VVIIDCANSWLNTYRTV